jgi:hypothetical protein
MKKILLLIIFLQTVYSQDSSNSEPTFIDLLNYPLEELESTIVYEPEKKPNWNSSLERFEYTAVVSEGLQDLKKDELYYRLVRWATLAFPSVKNVVELQDKSSGNIIIKASMANSNASKMEFSKRKNDKYDQFSNFTFPFVLDIRIKDGRYKYELYISKFFLEVELLGSSKRSSPVSSGVGESIPITNMQHNYLYSTKYSGFKPKNMYELVDEKAQELILNMHIYVLGQSLGEDW